MFLLSFVVAIVHLFGFCFGGFLLDSLKSSFENTTYKPIKDVRGVFMKMGAFPTASPFDFRSFLSFSGKVGTQGLAQTKHIL